MKRWILLAIIDKWILKSTSLPKQILKFVIKLSRNRANTLSLDSTWTLH